MEPSDLLRFVVDVMNRLNLRYFVTGSLVTVFYGEPRFTNDIDIVVDLPRDKITAFCRCFPPAEFYLSEDAVRQAVASRGQFNIIHPTSGLKADVIIPAESPYNRERFSRALRVQPESDYEACFASPEDVILKKMEYYQSGGSEKHLRDIAGVLKISGGRINFAYIEDWAGQMGLIDIWRAVRQKSAGP